MWYKGHVQSIWTNIHDPGWWFTAFFVAIIASLIAGYLKEPLANWFAQTFGWYRNRRQRAADRRTALVNALAADPIFLSIHTTTTAIRVVLFLFASLLFFLVPIWSEAMFSSPIFAARRIVRVEQVSFVTGVFVGIAGSMALLIGYRATRTLGINVDAYRLYRRQARREPT
jgi:hypothetical protein